MQPTRSSLPLVTIVPGDPPFGAILPHVERILEAASVDLRLDIETAATGSRPGGEVEPFSAQAVETLRKTGIGLTGHWSLPEERHSPDPNVTFRRELGLFASMAFVRTTKGLFSHHPEVDMVIIRESSEDLYSTMEDELPGETVSSLKVITERGCRRIVDFAFAYAKRYNRRKVTLVHKANIQKVTDGMFLRIGRERGEDHPGVELDDMIVDNAAMQIASRPQQFDVIVTTNLYGEILTGVAAGVAGGPSALAGHSTDGEIHLFEALHGGEARPHGHAEASPLPLLNCACLLAEHLGYTDAAGSIRTAVSKVIADGTVTADLGGSAKTAEMTEAVIRAVEAPG
jgi:isocitrate dehydrogenase (NAD+)